MNKTIRAGMCTVRNSEIQRSAPLVPTLTRPWLGCTKPIGTGLRLRPSLDVQPLDALELVHVAGHQGYAEAEGVGRKQKIVAADG